MALRTPEVPRKGTLKVYYPPSADLYLTDDGTPLYARWIIEEDDGNLYEVPAELHGWSRRSRYYGKREMLVPARPQLAEAVLSLVGVFPTYSYEAPRIA